MTECNGHGQLNVFSYKQTTDKKLGL